MDTDRQTDSLRVRKTYYISRGTEIDRKILQQTDSDSNNFPCNTQLIGNSLVGYLEKWYHGNWFPGVIWCNGIR